MMTTTTGESSGIVAVGGSWMVSREKAGVGEFAAVRRLTEQVVALVRAGASSEQDGRQEEQ